MICSESQKLLPGYLDGAIRAREHLRVREHLKSCQECRSELENYRLMTTRLANIEPVAPPADLALRIRAHVSRERPLWESARAWGARTLVALENILQPLAVPAAGGVLTALAVFVLVVHGMLVGVPMGGVVPNDLPLNLVQPAQLESLAPFPIADIAETDGRPNSGALLLEATLNAQGQVVYYKILSGPHDAAVQHQIDQVLMFSKFRPQLSFGRPTGGGRVLLSFSEVRVHG